MSVTDPEDGEPRPAGPPLVDSHGHVWWKTFDADRDEVLQRARGAGVRQMLVVGTDVETSLASFALAAEEPDLFPTAGIHPHDAGEGDADPGAVAAERERIEELCRRPECVAVGETGLDHFRNLSPRGAQLDNLYWHLDLARQLDKPVIIHSRDAHEDTARVLTEFRGVRGVLHCYDYGPDELEPYLQAGYFVSFSGIVTYANKGANREAARLVPRERLLVETDCPFLSPQDRRRARNEPANVRRVLEVVAETRDEPFDELAHATTANAGALFGLPALEEA